MKKSIIIISSLLMITFAAGSVFAWGPNKGNRCQGQGYNQECPRNGGQNVMNNLSQEQRDEIQALGQKFIDDTYEFRAEKSQKRNEMRMLMETSDPDRSKINKLSEQIMDLQEKIQEKRIDLQLAIKKIAPELGMGKGLRNGCGRQSQKSGQRNCPGQGGSGCGRFVN
jgi:zinc resistance-associated protein